MSAKPVTLATPMLDAEARRIAGIKAAAERPLGCGTEIVNIAPARGPVERFTPREVQVTEAGSFAIRRTGHNGHDALRIADAFSVMEAQAARTAKSRKVAPPPLFTEAQKSAGRTYAALAERLAAAGVRAISVEGRVDGSGGGGEFIDAVVRDSRRFDAMRAAVGSGWALEPQRASAEGTRRAIRLIWLVDMVCVGGLTVGQVLERFGWAAGGKNQRLLRAPLCDALDQMYDARPARPQNRG